MLKFEKKIRRQKVNTALFNVIIKYVIYRPWHVCAPAPLGTFHTSEEKRWRRKRLVKASGSRASVLAFGGSVAFATFASRFYSTALFHTLNSMLHGHHLALLFAYTDVSWSWGIFWFKECNLLFYNHEELSIIFQHGHSNESFYWKKMNSCRNYVSINSI